MWLSAVLTNLGLPHFCRHIIGGRLKHFSKHPIRYWMWTQASKLNSHHMLYAWITLATLMFTNHL